MPRMMQSKMLSHAAGVIKTSTAYTVQNIAKNRADLINK
jgi:hypothetical protein